MGDIIDPKPPQWERTPVMEDVREDGVIDLARRIMELIQQDLASTVEPTVLQLAALRLAQKAVIGNYQIQMGEEATALLLKQARELAGVYVVRGTDGTNEYQF